MALVMTWEHLFVSFAIIISNNYSFQDVSHRHDGEKAYDISCCRPASLAPLGYVDVTANPWIFAKIITMHISYWIYMYFGKM